MATGTAPAPGRWLYGPGLDLLVGCGGWYVLAFALLCAFGPAVYDHGGALWVPFLSLLVSTPHYGATLLRAYEQPGDRRAYALFTVHATALLLGLFAWGTHDVRVASWILTVYITWSPWHYTGQNYGIAVMYLRRRGVSLEGGAKRILYASFALSYLLTFAALHAGAPTSHYAPIGDAGGGVQFLRLGFAAEWSRPLVAVLAGAWGVSLVGALAMLLRRARLADLGPSLALVGLQALWFPVPLLFKQAGVVTGIEPWESPNGTYYFLWIATGHAAQYLWITSWYARRGSASSLPSGTARWVVKVLLAGAAIWTLPALLFAPGTLGTLPFDAGLAVLVAATVNLHHFVLDGALWKLRDGRVARVLLRDGNGTRLGAPLAAAWPRRAGVVWGIGALCLAVLLGAKLEADVRLPDALRRGDTAAASASLARLRWIGRDSAAVRVWLGRSLERRGDLRQAAREYQRALALQPSAPTWERVAGLRERAGDLAGAEQAHREAIALDPRHDAAHYQLGLLLLRRGAPAQARDAFATAMALNPERGIHRRLWERASREADAARSAPAEPALAERAVAGSAQAGPPPGR